MKTNNTFHKFKGNEELILFQNKKIRKQEYEEEWYYSIVDVIEILMESKKPNDYWNKPKKNGRRIS